MSEIIVGVDGSARAEDAIAFARRLAGVTGAPLTLAGAYPYDELLGQEAGPEYREYLHVETAAMLNRLRRRMPEEEVATKAIADTSPARALHGLAAEEEASLIVVGSTHRGLLGRVLVGTTAERLLHGAPCPVAVVPRDYRTRSAEPIRTVGVGFDGSDESQLALTTAIEVARRLRAELRVIRVFDTAVLGTVAGTGYAAVVGDLEAAAREGLDETIAAVPHDIAAVGVFVSGDPARELATRSEQLDLLVLGSRGYGPRRAVLLGGVSHVVVRKAACPVIVLPRGARPGVGELFAPAQAASAG